VPKELDRSVKWQVDGPWPSENNYDVYLWVNDASCLLGYDIIDHPQRETIWVQPEYGSVRAHYLPKSWILA